jgi:predicted Zn-dependent peptidase
VIAALAMIAIGAPKVVALPDDGPAWVELRIAFPGGADEDPKEKSGLAHVASLVLERRLAPLGARVHLGRRGIAIALGAPASEVERAAIDAIDAIAKEPTKVEIDAAVRLAAERRRRFADDDRALAEMELARALGVPEHILGALDELATVAREDVLIHQRRFWDADRMLVVVSGGFEAELTQKLTARLGKLQRPAVKKEPKPQAGTTPRAGLFVLLVDKPNRRRAHVALGRRVGAIDAAKLAANAGLGGSMSGRLSTAMQRTPFAGAHAFSTLREDQLVIWSAVKPERSAAAITRILETLADVAKRGLDAEEITVGKRVMAAQSALSQRDAASRADAVVRAHLSAAESEASFLELKDEEVRRASQSLARADGLTIVVVAGATAQLQAALVAIPGVKEVQVARYDQR